MSVIDYNKLFERKCVDDAGRERSLEGIIRAMGPNVDMEQFKASGAGTVIVRMMEYFALNPDEHSPTSIAYWAELGMIKEFHGEDVPMDWETFCREKNMNYPLEHAYPQNLWKKWASYVPATAFKEENIGRKYPLVIALHGGGNTIYIVDSWGIAQEAARREWIVIMPSLESDAVIGEILEEAKKLYPIDAERIYLFGFSYGSINTNILAHQHPDWFAAVAPCGGEG